MEENMNREASKDQQQLQQGPKHESSNEGRSKRIIILFSIIVALMLIATFLYLSNSEDTDKFGTTESELISLDLEEVEEFLNEIDTVELSASSQELRVFAKNSSEIKVGDKAVLDWTEVKDIPEGAIATVYLLSKDDIELGLIRVTAHTFVARSYKFMFTINSYVTGSDLMGDTEIHEISSGEYKFKVILADGQNYEKELLSQVISIENFATSSLNIYRNEEFGIEFIRLAAWECASNEFPVDGLRHLQIICDVKTNKAANPILVIDTPNIKSKTAENPTADIDLIREEEISINGQAVLKRVYQGIRASSYMFIEYTGSNQKDKGSFRAWFPFRTDEGTKLEDVEILGDRTIHSLQIYSK